MLKNCFLVFPIKTAYVSLPDASQISLFEKDLQPLKNNIAGEKAAIAEYKSIIGYVDDDGIRAVLKRIVLDEEEHLQALECLYSRFCS